jgi:hypothetical protein
MHCRTCRAELATHIASLLALFQIEVRFSYLISFCRPVDVLRSLVIAISRSGLGSAGTKGRVTLWVSDFENVDDAYYAGLFYSTVVLAAQQTLGSALDTKRLSRLLFQQYYFLNANQCENSQSFFKWNK